MKNENIYQNQKKRSPFELLNSINQQKRTYFLAIFILGTISLFELVLIGYLSQKPPLVIRIDKFGKTQVTENYQRETELTTMEDIQNFSQIFLRNYVALRSDRVVTQFHKSLNMMTEEFAKNHLRSMKDNQTIRKIQAANIRNNLDVLKPKIEVVGDTIYVQISGKILTRPLKELNAIPDIKTIDANLILVKIDRNPEHPYGLLLQDIKLQIDKETRDINQNMNEVTKK